LHPGGGAIFEEFWGLIFLIKAVILVRKALIWLERPCFG